MKAHFEMTSRNLLSLDDDTVVLSVILQDGRKYAMPIPLKEEIDCGFLSENLRKVIDLLESRNIGDLVFGRYLDGVILVGRIEGIKEGITTIRVGASVFGCNETKPFDIAKIGLAWEQI